MSWRSRRRTPVWVWLLALLGIKSLWLRRVQSADPAWQEKSRRFREKLDEAFQVWREAPPSASSEATDD